MSVLEAPATWIAAAAVLVVIAVVLIALAPRRRSGAAAGRSAGPAAGQAAASTPAAASAASAETAPAAPPAAASVPAAAPSSSSPVPSPATDDDDAVTGPVLPSTPREPVRGDAGVDDDVRTAEVAPRPAARVAAPADEPVTAETPPMTVRERYVPVTDPARADGHAKDRLLAALLSDPTAAVDVVAAMPENGAPASGSSAAALLRAGLSPAQAAQLCGVEPGDLATLVARDLGLLGAARGGGAQRERSRTEEPGRAWASAGSAAGSTTPTTG